MEQLKGLGRSVPEADGADVAWDAYAVWKERVLLPRQGRLADLAPDSADVSFPSLVLVPRSGS